MAACKEPMDPRGHLSPDTKLFAAVQYHRPGRDPSFTTLDTTLTPLRLHSFQPQRLQRLCLEWFPATLIFLIPLCTMPRSLKREGRWCYVSMRAARRLCFFRHIVSSTVVYVRRMHACVGGNQFPRYAIHSSQPFPSPGSAGHRRREEEGE